VYTEGTGDSKPNLLQDAKKPVSFISCVFFSPDTAANIYALTLETVPAKRIKGCFILILSSSS
jgi:Pyruvate/2-oxoacid:ferredoxin oxidoreductase delta subunit